MKEVTRAPKTAIIRKTFRGPNVVLCRKRKFHLNACRTSSLARSLRKPRAILKPSSSSWAFNWNRCGGSPEHFLPRYNSQLNPHFGYVRCVWAPPPSGQAEKTLFCRQIYLSFSLPPSLTLLLASGMSLDENCSLFMGRVCVGAWILKTAWFTLGLLGSHGFSQISSDFLRFATFFLSLSFFPREFWLFEFRHSIWGFVLQGVQKKILKSLFVRFFLRFVFFP